MGPTARRLRCLSRSGWPWSRRPWPPPGSYPSSPERAPPPLPDAVTLTRHAFAAGADAVLIMPPFYYKRPPDAGVATWLQRLIDAAVPPGGRVLLYHIPQTTGVPITDTLWWRILFASHPEAIYGIKDSTGDSSSGLVHLRTTFPGTRLLCRQRPSDRPPRAAMADAGSSPRARTSSPIWRGPSSRRPGAAGTWRQFRGHYPRQRSLLESYPLQPATKTALTEVADCRPPLFARRRSSYRRSS